MDVLNKIWEILTQPPNSPDFLESFTAPVSEYLEGHLVNLLYKGVIGAIRFLQRILLTTPTIFIKTPHFWQTYRILISLSLIVMIAVILWIAILKTYGSHIEFKDIQNKLLIYPFAVIFGPYLLMKFVDIFNRISSTIINTDGMILPKEITGQFLFGIIISMIIFTILSYKLVFFYGKRTIKILLFAVSLPVLLVLSCLPSHPEIINNWIEGMMSLLISQVIHALIFLIVGTIVLGASEIDNTLTIVYQIGALGVMNEAESIIGQFAGSRQRLVPDSWGNEVKRNKQRLETGKNVFNKAKGALRWWLLKR